MLKFIAKRWAKTRYVFNQHVEAATNDLNAGLALRTAADKRDLSARLTKEADEMDARIKELDEKLDKGFWECEKGHENSDAQRMPCETGGDVAACIECKAPVKFIRRDQMTGQEKYESDKERGEAEKMAADKRAQAKATEDSAAESEKASKYFRDLAQSNRAVAEKVWKL